MNIKRKLICFLVCFIMLATIPLVAGMTPDANTEDPQTSDFGRTIIRGFVFNYRPSGFGHRFFALRIHYIEITGRSRTMGVVTLRPVSVGREANIGFNYCGPAGMFGYMFAATFKGGIDY